MSFEAELSKENFVHHLVSKTTIYSNNYKKDVENLTLEIISYATSAKQIKDYKSLIAKFEKEVPNSLRLDKLYAELIFLTAAYQYASFILHFGEPPN